VAGEEEAAAEVEVATQAVEGKVVAQRTHMLRHGL
jgi:hypothetical protein